MISITIPKEGEKATPETFKWKLDWDRIREARANDEGTYLLRTNLPGCDPKTLWKRYMIQVVMPTTDGRVVTLPRYVELKQDLVILLDRLGLTLPAQPPPKISSEAAESAKTTV